MYETGEALSRTESHLVEAGAHNTVIAVHNALTDINNRSDRIIHAQWVYHIWTLFGPLIIISLILVPFLQL